MRGSSPIEHAVGVDEPPARPHAPARRPPSSRASGRDAAQALVAEGKSAADVAEAGRAEKRVDQRVSDHIAVGVAGEPARVVDLDPAEHERHAVVEGVGVDADPDAVLSHGPNLASDKVVTCALRRPAAPRPARGRPGSSPSAAARRPGRPSRARRPPRRARRSRSPRPRRAARSTGATNACGVCTATSSSRASVSTTTPSRDALDRVRDRQARHGAVEALAERLEQPRHDLGRQQRPRRVVDEHDRRVRRAPRRARRAPTPSASRRRARTRPPSTPRPPPRAGSPAPPTPAARPRRSRRSTRSRRGAAAARRAAGARRGARTPSAAPLRAARPALRRRARPRRRTGTPATRLLSPSAADLAAQPSSRAPSPAASRRRASAPGR